MDELEPLQTALRQELGSPPDAWQQAQRARVRAGLRAPARPPLFRKAAPWVLASLALFSVLVWFVASRPAASADQELVAEALKEPFRLDDGSSISLDPGARGRLSAGDAGVHFDLEQGRASFNVNPARKRKWRVSAGKNEVRVVGTRFSVTYGPADGFEVNVERGIVAVQVPGRPASVELKAGEHFRGRSERVETVRNAAPSLGPAAEPRPTLVLPTSPSAVPSGAEAPATPATTSDWLARYRAGKYAEALALVRSTGVDKRLGELSPTALSDLAEAARLGGDSDLAVRALTALLRRFAGTAEAREARFLLGRVQALRGDRTAAIAAFEGYLAGRATRYENEALGQLMELYSARGDRERAREIAQRYLERAPKGPYHLLAQSLISP